MSSPLPFDAQEWAAATFGAADLGDPRRTRRAVQVGAALMANPAASLPQQTGSHAALKGAYRLVHASAVTLQQLLTPTYAATRTAASAHDLVLLVGDTTILDYSHHPTTTGLGRVGDGRGRGFLAHSVLAVLPDTRQVLGLAYQGVHCPAPTRQQETLRQMQARERATDVWQEAVETIGGPPGDQCWVQVTDSEGDLFRALAACRAVGSHFLVRAGKDRLVGEEGASFFPTVRAWPAQARQTLVLPPSHGKPERTIEVAVSLGAVQLQPPRQEKLPADRARPLDVWVVRVWEPEPEEGVDPVEWVLVTDVPTTTLAEAWERVGWYRCRWIIEDYHACLKTGCRLEQRNLGEQEALERLLGLCAPVAVELLRLRDLARASPEQLAHAVLPPEIVAVVAALAEVDPQTLTVQTFWLTVAKRGGYLGRRRDRPPGWKILWRGWHDIQLLLEGVRLAHALSP